MGLKLSTYDPLTQTWPIATAEVVAPSTTLYAATNPGEPPPVGFAVSNGDLVLAVRTNTPADLHSFRKVAGSTTWTLSDLNEGTPVDIRLCTAGTYFTWLGTLNTAGVASARLFGSVNNAATWASSLATAFDCIYTPGGGRLLATAAVNGELRPFHGFGSAQAFPGVVRGGVPSPTLNADPLCTADAPEMLVRGNKLVVSWQERCGTGPWKSYVRVMQ
jgi:hypothetical protein